MTLRGLIQAVVRGDEPYMWDLAHSLGLSHMHWVGAAFNGSLDAAKRLHDALLPGWMVECMCQLLEVGENGEYTGGTDGWLVNLRHLPDGHSEDSATAETPAGAWLLSILRALEQEGRDD